MRITTTDHAIDRVDSRITAIAPELKEFSRFEKLIRRSGKWFLNDDGAYYCLINKLIVCVFRADGNWLTLVTTYPYAKSFVVRMKYMCKIDVSLD